MAGKSNQQQQQQTSILNDNLDAIKSGRMTLSEKTVFVVDRAIYFSDVSSHHSISVDSINKDQHQKGHHHSSKNDDHLIKIKPFEKSLWTCSMEAVVEYSRLAWDLFPSGERTIAIISSLSELCSMNDDSPEVICDWSDDQQNLNHLMRSLAKSRHHTCQVDEPLGETDDISLFPNSNGENLRDALDKAFELICTLIPVQQKRATAKNLNHSNNYLESNEGRIVIVSSFQNESCIMKTIDYAKELVHSKYKSIVQETPGSSKTTAAETSSIKHAPIKHCEILIINTFPLEDQGPTSQIKEIALTHVDDKLSYQVSSVKSGRFFTGMLSNFCLQHYNLRSTTITGIPMKEEQNASSSSNYDVEIMHCSSAHDDLTKSGNPIFEGVVNEKYRHGFPYKSYTLRWCTPRTNNVELYHCINTSRITSVDVNSRPSSCLTNFLLNGRAVMLEIYKSKSSRMTSHMLASHNGELYIHTLSTANHKLNFDDPPSILDGVGGKVQDYRDSDFNDFIKRNTLTTCKVLEGARKETIYPLHKALNPIKKQTLYWPLISGHTILYNMQPQVARLLACIPKDNLIMENVLECKKNIYDILNMENDGVALSPPTISSLTKSTSGPSRGSQTKLNNIYKLLWNELEYFIRVNSTTPEHETILECLMECRASDKKHVPDKKDTKSGKRSNKSKNTDLSTSSPTEDPPTKKLKSTNQLIPTNTESLNPELLTHYKSGLTLMQTWSSLYDLAYRSKSRTEFFGRLEGHKYKLYTHLDNDSSMTSLNQTNQERDFDSIFPR